MKLLYYILHTFLECKDENLNWTVKNNKAVCSKCGRVYFGFRV